MKKRGWNEVRRDVHDEVSFHIESAVRDLMAAGLDEETARREAVRRFGSVERVEGRLLEIGARRVRRRRLRGMAGDLGQDVRFALRSLRRRRAYAALMVGILGLGLAVNIAVLRVVDGALVRPLPFPEGDALVRLFAGDAEADRFPLSWPEYEDWVREATFLDGAGAAWRSGVTLRATGGEPEAVMAGGITGGLMDVLRVGPVAGRAITPEDVVRGERVAMLDERAWRTRFGGDPAVLGTTLHLDEEAYTVIGVMPSSVHIPLQLEDVQVWVPFVEEDWMIRSTHFLRAIGRLAEGVDAARGGAAAERLEQALREQGLTDHGLVLMSVREQVVAPGRPVLLALTGAVVFVLLIVCANLTNLFLAQSIGRSREFAVRASLGAGRFRIGRQVATEGAVIGLAGGALGLGLSRLLHGVVHAATGQAARLAPGAFDARIIVATLLLSLLAGVMIGLWPALRAGGGAPGQALASGTRTAGDRRAWARRRWLVGTEVALTVVLVAGAGLMVRSVARLLDQDPGFVTTNLLTFDVDLPTSRYADDAAIALFFGRLLDDVRALPGVVTAGAVTALPLSGSDTNGSFSVVGVEYPDSVAPHGKKRVATPGYLEALGVPLLEGRTFTEQDRAGARDVVVISESLARQHFPDGAVGRLLEFAWGPTGQQEVVGVVGDVRHDGLDGDPVATLYRAHAHFPIEGMTVVVRTSGDPLALAAAARAAVRRLDPLLPVTQVRSMEQVLAASVGDRRTLMRLLAGFAGLALLLAALGVYAVTAQAVQQRTREIGVRMAIGARARDVLRMVVREELPAIVLGLALGLAGTVAATRVLEASLFGVTARDPGTLAAALALIVLAALLATLLPARRAARTDPAVALRNAN